MAKYIGKRLIHLIGILIALSFLTFLLMYLAPGVVNIGENSPFDFYAVGADTDMP